MNTELPPDMLEATRLTREGRLAEATALLQRLLGRGAKTPDTPAAAPPPKTGDARAGFRPPRIIDVEPETGRAEEPGPSSSQSSTHEPGAGQWRPESGMSGGAKPQMPEAVQGFLDRLNQRSLKPAMDRSTRRPPLRPSQAVPEGAHFMAGSFSTEAGSRPYKLYIPSNYRREAAPLVVMLHGCTQSPDDFAAGTRMNVLAEEHGFLVVYPAQTPAANAQKCWNWFSPDDQCRDRGEPSLIAGITRQIMREHVIDQRRVYIAGLSAGGAAAAIMGRTYPELYTAVGVHSGLACGAARDLPSALAAMRQGAAGAPPAADGTWTADGLRRLVPTIVFHADRDSTVHPRNGDQVIAQSVMVATTGLRTQIQRGQVPGGHAYSRTLHLDEEGRVVLEQWLVHGGGHAWAGGSPAGSYTDPRGPDASREMIRFFLGHSHSTVTP